jgi:chromosome segregation ATPase
MIKDLIVRLMEEANEEAERKGWCDTELKTNAVTRNAKTAQVETLHAQIEELQALLQKQAQQLQDTSAEIQELTAAVATATEQRTKQQAANEVTIKEAKEAQVAVAQAIEVLKEFYAKAADATALVQGAQPAVFDAPYTGMGGESGGVLGMLEVIQSDFGRLEAETSASEEEAARTQKKFVQEAAVNKARLEKDVEHLGRKRTEREGDLNEAHSDLTGAQEELDAALAYYEKLKPSCVDAGVTYEDRVSRRKQEIESLQEALRILNGEDLA